MLFYNRRAWWKILRGIGLVPMDAAHWVRWGEGIEALYSTNSSCIPLNILLRSFIFVTFLIQWPLSPVASSVSWCRSCFVYSGLTYGIYSRGGSSTYVYCMVCYHVMAAPYVINIAVSFHTVTLLMTIRNTQ